MIIFIAFLVLRKPTPSTKEGPTPTTLPISLPPEVITEAAGLSVVKIEPENEAKEVQLRQRITITFNRQIKPENIKLLITSGLDYSQSDFEFYKEVRGENLIITPKERFSPGTTYYMEIVYKPTNHLLTNSVFTTTGPTTTPPPNTAPSGFIEEQEEFQRKNYPDVFLSNKAPFETDTFSVTSDYTSEPTDHFYFIVSLKGPDHEKAKENATNWVKSLGLTEEQINSLDITYREE